MALLALAVTVFLGGCAANPERLKELGIEKHNFHYDTRLTTRKKAGNVYNIHVQAPKGAKDVPLIELAFLAAAKTALANDFPRFIVLPRTEYILEDEDAIAARKKMLAGKFNTHMKKAVIRASQTKRCRREGYEMSNCKVISRYAEANIILVKEEEAKRGVSTIKAANLIKGVKEQLSLE